MTLKKIKVAAFLLAISPLSIAAPSINDMQACQGLIDFIGSKLESASSKYESEDIQTIRKGLDGYNQYIQRDIVSPGLLKFNRGDAEKASLMQKQVDDYKKTVVNGLHARYPQDGLFTDQVLALNNCAKKAVPAGQELNDLKEAFTVMSTLVPAY